MQDRRQFFQSLIAGGATVHSTRKRVSHAGDIRLYHGPMEIPAHVAEAVREDPSLYRPKGGHRGGAHLLSRYAEADGTVYLFRCQIPAHRGMVGEIVRTPLGPLRVHCWTAADPANYDEPAIIAERKASRPLSNAPIMPPAPQPGWQGELA